MSENIAEPVVVSPNPTDPQVIFTKLFLKALISTGAKFPIEAPFRKNLREMSDNLAETIRANQSVVSKVGKGGTVAAVSTLVYWLGFYAGHLWFPPAGLAFALLGAAGITTGYKMICEGRRDFEFISLYYSCLLLMQGADNVISDQERKVVASFLDSLSLKEKQREALAKIQIRSLDDISVPNWLDADQKRALFMGCWSLVYCDGVADVETRLFSEMARKFGIDESLEAAIKKEAEANVEAIEEKILRTGATVMAFATSELVDPEAVIDLVSSLSIKVVSRETTRERMKAAAPAAGSPAGAPNQEEEPAALPTILMSSYVMSRGLLRGKSDAGPELDAKFLEHCRKSGAEALGKEFPAFAGEAFSLFRRGITG